MKKIASFTGIIVALALVLVIFFFRDRYQTEELEHLRQEVKDLPTLRAQNLALQQFQDQAAEVDSARKNQRELVKLRNEVAGLRADKQKLTTDWHQALSAIATLKESNQAHIAPPPGQVPAGYVASDSETVKNACINHLRRLDAAMQQWALEHQGRAEDHPTQNDLLPYLQSPDNPWSWICPGGGSYVFGRVDELPRCTLPGHVLPQQ